MLIHVTHPAFWQGMFIGAGLGLLLLSGIALAWRKWEDRP